MKRNIKKLTDHMIERESDKQYTVLVIALSVIAVATLVKLILIVGLVLDLNR